MIGFFINLFKTQPIPSRAEQLQGLRNPSLNERRRGFPEPETHPPMPGLIKSEARIKEMEAALKDARHWLNQEGIYSHAVQKIDKVLAHVDKPQPLIVKSPDAHVEAIRDRFLERSIMGFKKYGVTTERTDLTEEQWLRHLQEELMDGIIYIEAALHHRKQPARPHIPQPTPEP